MEVVYDEEGHPIHPETNDPARTLSEEIIFAMNAFFLCFWPYLKFIDSRAERKAEEALDDAATTDEEGEGEEEEEETTIGRTAGDESRTDEAESDRPRRVEMQLGRHQVANVRPSVDEMGNPIDPGKVQRNVRGESVEETPESEPDTDVMGREQAQWQKGAHKAQAATPGAR
ncbi:hypothetical protein CDAR_282121 [Caerostris darwini]|uniref:Uncharacterized protein n=1 Tax=Caerostris darwini TaxID=1538125 RepID=A0AAV4WSA1_9ARAC|nr:hypothetical protein CDAR_282121 [Caerostris darwini]